MRVQCERALLEVQLQLELDEQRGLPPLAPRARALRQARAAGVEQAQRQALIDLAAACVAMAARLPAPIQALNERELPGYGRPPVINRRAAEQSREAQQGGTAAVHGRDAPVRPRPYAELNTRSRRRRTLHTARGPTPGGRPLCPMS